MSTEAVESKVSKPSDSVASEVRAHLARRGLSLRAFEQLLGVPQLWAVRRVGPSRTVDLSLEDLYLIARALEIHPADLLDP